MKTYIDERQLNLFKSSLKKTRLKLGKKDISDIDPSYGVAGNTFRAYRKYNKKPSIVYQEWAKKQTNKIIKSQPTMSVSTNAKFKKWHKRLYDSLNRYWNKNQDKKLSLAHGYKLVDLYIKWLSGYDFPDKKFVNYINQYASCVLDSKTLNKVNLCYSSCLPINEPSMGHIANQNTYDFCQNIINEFCIKEKGTKLEFDYWAWKKGG